MKQIENKEISPELEQYIGLLKRMYERMERENSWPWLGEQVEPELLD